MWLHLGSFVVSIYLLINKEVKIEKEYLKNSYLVFLIFVSIAMYLNLVIYNLGILNGETFNMFYISPYFISPLPVYNLVQESVPYLIYLIFYLVTIFLGAIIIYYSVKFISKIKTTKSNHDRI